MKKAAGAKTHPFFNPHLLTLSEDRLELHKAHFQRLLQSAKAWLFNSGTAGVDKIREITGSK